MDELLTVKEVAARLKVNPQTVRRWIRAGRLPAVQIAARAYRIREDDVMQHVFVPPPPLTPEQLERQRRVFDRLRALREEFRGRGPSLQEILDEMRQEHEERDALGGP